MEQIHITGIIKEDKYKNLLPQLHALLLDEKDRIANYANVCAALQSVFNFHWIGFYRVLEDELVLGPFQGPVACTRIKKGKGVCGSAWEQKRTICVPNVHEFEGHIACSPLSNSEIVVPVFVNHELVAVLDVDSSALDYFDAIDQEYLEKICECLN